MEDKLGKKIQLFDYVLTRFKLEPALSQELEANLRISEEVLRHLLIKVE